MVRTRSQGRRTRTQTRTQSPFVCGTRFDPRLHPYAWLLTRHPWWLCAADWGRDVLQGEEEHAYGEGLSVPAAYLLSAHERVDPAACPLVSLSHMLRASLFDGSRLHWPMPRTTTTVHPPDTHSSTLMLFLSTATHLISHPPVPRSSTPTQAEREFHRRRCDFWSTASASTPSRARRSWTSRTWTRSTACPSSRKKTSGRAQPARSRIR